MGESPDATAPSPKASASLPPPRAKAKAGSNWTVRGVLRALHRDAGYFFVGLTLIYALSGIAVNHVADWDPNFRNYETKHHFDSLDAASDQALAADAAKRLGITAEARDVYRSSEDRLDVTFDKRSLHLTHTGSGWDVVDEGQKPRFLIRVANWLHLNRGKKAWTYMADGYAVGLLFLATSGLFMIKGKKGLVWRGLLVASLGIAVPTGYVVLSGGPDKSSAPPSGPGPGAQ